MTDGDTCVTCGAVHRRLYAPRARQCRRCVLASVEANTDAARQRQRDAFSVQRRDDELSAAPEAVSVALGRARS